MCLNQFEIQHDILQNFDPRARLAASFFLILTAVTLSNYIPLTIMIVICILLLCRDILCVMKRLVPVELFCLLFIIQAFFDLIKIESAVVFIVRVNAAALIYMLMVVPAGIGVLAQAFLMLKINSKLASIFYLSFRYIYLMHDSVLFSINAMKLRENSRQRNVVYKWRLYAAVFASALTKAFVKADGINMALYTRGFDGIIPQTVILKWRIKDAFLVVCCGVLLLLYGTYKIFGHLFFV
ncbi:MAG: energy-coupling factor transporter transmembrane protein EcfT [Spirochaetaceae bacterium]|jgi:energy-coupling factor transporter transmembrane protein EcfT|nr:energy-coupling factor transporter transmembrane protein EcfT [Spirochaetaceae bacterium]